MSSDVEERTPYVGALMLAGWQWVRARVYEGVRQAGYDDLNPAHVSLFRYPTLDRLRPTEIAERMQITKQSVHDLLTHLDERGYIERHPDPSSKRSRIVRLSAKGRGLEREVRSQARRAEDEIAAILGPRQFAHLRDALEALAPRLDAGSPSAKKLP